MGIARSTYYDRSEKPADCSAGRSIMCIHKPDQRNHRTTHPKTARLAEALENLVGWFFVAEPVKCADGEICGLLLTFDTTPTVVETRNGADMFEFKPLPAWQIKSVTARQLVQEIIDTPSLSP